MVKGGSSQSDERVADFLAAEYKPRLRELICKFSDVAQGESGFYSSAAKNINRTLQRLGIDEIPEQYANDLHSGRKVTRDGVGLYLAYRLGAALGNVEEPSKAIFIFYLWVCGQWPEKESAADVLKRLQMSVAAGDSHKAMIELSKKMDKILEVIGSEKPAQPHPLTVLLRSNIPDSDDELEQKIREAYEGYETSGEKMVAVFCLRTLPPLRSLWLQISNVLNSFARGEGEPWSPKRIEQEARALKLSESQSASLLPSQSSKSLAEDVLPI